MFDTFIDQTKLFLTTAGINILTALFLLVIGICLINISISILKKWIQKSKIDAILHKFILSVVKFTAILFLLISCAKVVGIDTTSIVTAFGAASIAVGLALQSSLANLAGGLFIIITKPFKIGDMVEVSGGVGKVLEIGLVHTVLVSDEGNRILIPNGDVQKSKITNFSR